MAARTPERYIALLRGVNVGGVKVPMARLTELCDGLGWTDVKTYGNSGNVRFDATISASTVARELEAALQGEFDRKIDVVVRTPAELGDAAQRCAANGKPSDGPKGLHVGFCNKPLPTDAFDDVDWEAVAPDHAVIDGAELLLRYPDGMGRSKMNPQWFRKHLGKAVVCTVRSLKVIRTLSEL
ncbi:MAG: DUF1697 domain-containing protein [Acidimicrobiales bacterium]